MPQDFALTNITIPNHNLYMQMHDKALLQLEQLERAIADLQIDLHKLENLQPEQVQSALDGYDYLFGVVFGIIGAFISSSKQIAEFCNIVHVDASKSNPDTLLGKLLHHYGDAIDKVNGKYVDRNGNSADIMFHRLMFGHDPFSLGHDNPFLIMTKQHGLLLGILQVFRHLISDTFSKQGLPIPGHSLLDRSVNGKTTNLLKEIAQSVGGDRMGASEAFSRMFTIRAQDIGAQGLVWASTQAYIHYRQIEAPIRQRQYKILTYGTCFLANTAYGLIRYRIPYINWPILCALIKEITGLFIDSNRETVQLEKITAKIIEENAKLEKQVFATGTSLVSYVDGFGYINEIRQQEKQIMNIVEFWEEN